MKHSLLILFVPCALLVCSVPLRGQEATEERTIDDPSPDERYAFLRVQPAESESQKTCDLIEKASGKVLLRVAQSDVGDRRLGVEVLWSRDSKRFALFTTYNHFGAELSVYLRTGGTYRKLTLPDLSVPEIPKWLERGHEWKWTNIRSERADRWQPDGTLHVRAESVLHAINSPLVLTSRRNVVFGFSQSGKVTILKSRRKVFMNDEND